MPKPESPIRFETSLVTKQPDGELLIALFDGSENVPREAPACVGLFLCRTATGISLMEAVRSALKGE